MCARLIAFHLCAHHIHSRDVHFLTTNHNLEQWQRSHYTPLHIRNSSSSSNSSSRNDNDHPLEYPAASVRLAGVVA